MTRPFRLRRSELSTPGSSPKMMAKAAAGAADLVFLDLEDAVAPSEKVGARAHVVEALNTLDWGRKTRAVRINGVDTPWGVEDLIEVVTRAGSDLDVIIVPKVKSRRDVWFIDTLLGYYERKLGLPERGIGLELLIEESEALSTVEKIAGCCPRIEALILGVGDLSASQGMRLDQIGATGNYPGDLWHYARNRVFSAARANGLVPIDGPYADYRNDDGYRREAGFGAVLGAVGKWAIHPAQVPLANEIYSPTADEITKPREIVSAFEQATASGAGAVAAGGVMLDAASVRICQTVLDLEREITAREDTARE
jgi:citrate lyase subunit beta/citryl-CoA lyase